jgi:uncharacterized protein YciI
MIYVFYCEDAENNLQARREHRPAHLERLHELKAQGRLILAGPFPAIDSPEPGEAGFSGSLIVAEFPSLDEAEQWAAADPFCKFGVYRKVTVKPVLKTLP